MMGDNNTEKQIADRPHLFRSFKRIVTLVISIVTIFSAIVGIITWRDSRNSRPKVRLSVLDHQGLTKVAAMPNLKSRFEFDGREVRNLWVSKLRLENECTRNIIGIHGHDLMSSNMCLLISKDFRIITAELEQNEFAARLSYDDSEIALSFDKWKPNQTCILKVYGEGLNGDDNKTLPYFYSSCDPFTQGELLISEYQEIQPKVCLLKHLPYWLDLTCSYVGIGVFSIIVVLIICWLLGIWVNMIKRLIWERKYLKEAEYLISQLATDNEAGGDVEYMKKSFWEQHKIPVPPKKSDSVRNGKIKWGELLAINIIIGIVLLIVLIAMGALIYI